MSEFCTQKILLKELFHIAFLETSHIASLHGHSGDRPLGTRPLKVSEGPTGPGAIGQEKERERESASSLLTQFYLFGIAWDLCLGKGKQE